MNKFLKLGTVSMLAIVAATAANAAGYTCEELVEYTSCNTGYYLNNGECIPSNTCGAGNYINICPDGLDFMKDVCCNDEDEYCRISTNCNDEYDNYYAQACVKLIDSEIVRAEPINETITCTPCVAGTYQPNAGQYSCIKTPAGNFSAPGATQYTACTPGTYSLSGAATCSTCPTHEYTNAKGETVTVPATSLAGAAGVLACYVDPNTYFTDLTGTYHFKSNCSFSLGNPTSAEECQQIYGGIWTGSHSADNEYCCEVTQEFASAIITTQSDCESVSFNEYEPNWYNGECHCKGNAAWAVRGGKLVCERIDY